jgi:hypothetical protein
MPKYMTPEDVEEERMSKKAEKAYNKAMPEADTTFGNLEKEPEGRGFTRAEIDKIRAGETGAKARKAGFTNAETKGGAALMYRNPMGKKMASGGSVGSASKRADGCASKGKTRGKFV